MGFLWDLMQQSQLNRQDRHGEALEARVAALESELDRTQTLLRTLIERLETHLSTDLNRDGRIG